MLPELGSPSPPVALEPADQGQVTDMRLERLQHVSVGRVARNEHLGRQLLGKGVSRSKPQVPECSLSPAFRKADQEKPGRRSSFGQRTRQLAQKGQRAGDGGEARRAESLEKPSSGESRQSWHGNLALKVFPADTGPGSRRRRRARCPSSTPGCFHPPCSARRSVCWCPHRPPAGGRT